MEWLCEPEQGFEDDEKSPFTVNLTATCDDYDGFYNTKQGCHPVELHPKDGCLIHISMPKNKSKEECVTNRLCDKAYSLYIKTESLPFRTIKKFILKHAMAGQSGRLTYRFEEKWMLEDAMELLLTECLDTVKIIRTGYKLHIDREIDGLYDNLFIFKRYDPYYIIMQINPYGTQNESKCVGASGGKSRRNSRSEGVCGCTGSNS